MYGYARVSTFHKVAIYKCRLFFLNFLFAFSFCVILCFFSFSFSLAFYDLFQLDFNFNCRRSRCLFHRPPLLMTLHRLAMPSGRSTSLPSTTRFVYTFISVAPSLRPFAIRDRRLDLVWWSRCACESVSYGPFGTTSLAMAYLFYSFHPPDYSYCHSLCFDLSSPLLRWLNCKFHFAWTQCWASINTGAFWGQLSYLVSFSAFTFLDLEVM